MRYSKRGLEDMYDFIVSLEEENEELKKEIQRQGKEIEELKKEKMIKEEKNNQQKHEFRPNTTYNKLKTLIPSRDDCYDNDGWDDDFGDNNNSDDDSSDNDNWEFNDN